MKELIFKNGAGYKHMIEAIFHKFVSFIKEINLHSNVQLITIYKHNKNNA